MRTPTGKTGRAVLAVAAAAFLLAPLAAGTAGAQSANPTDQARQHFTRGKELFATGEYRGAMAEFAAADKLAPSPLLEFNIALCHERLGERAEAVRRYRLYLDRVPDAPNREAVEAKIAHLEGEMKADAEEKRAPPPVGGLVPPPVGQGGAPGPGAGGPPDASQPSPSGDPELDRAARIDIGRLRSQRTGRQGAGPGEPPPPNRAAGVPPEPAASAPASPRPPKDDGGVSKKETPIYKKWWFWAVAAVGAVVIYSIATADSDSSDGRALMLPLGDMRRESFAQPGGAVLLRF